ncbi:MAG: molecular chaperone TorD family protein [Desulfobacula sp.]|jgi:putative dimethyl sulfoxide reductase chaperone|nr:molecular chaperone TorD family protein [Desulfobacula sp.]
MDIQNIITHETARQDAYKSLANLYRLPEKTIQENLDVLTEQLMILNSKSASYLTDMQTDFDQNSDLDLLKVEFTRLFIGPYSLPAPPYGSVYIENERKVMGDSTMDARKRYQHFGLDIPGNFKDVPDHITVELEFIFFLIFKEIVHIQSNLPEQAQELLFHQKSFHTDHLNIWIPEFTDCVIEYTGTQFYRNLATATKIFITEELEYLESVCVSVTPS